MGEGGGGGWESAGVEGWEGGWERGGRVFFFCLCLWIYVSVCLWRFWVILFVAVCFCLSMFMSVQREVVASVSCFFPSQLLSLSLSQSVSILFGDSCALVLLWLCGSERVSLG